MSWLLVAIGAQVILGTSAVFDKLLLKRQFVNPWGYVFWVGVLGLFSLALAPFGFISIPTFYVLLALAAGAVFILAMIFLFLALDKSMASEALPIIGGFSPVFTLFLSFIFLGGWVGINLADLIGFSFLVIGGFLLFLTSGMKPSLRTIVFILASAALFGFANVLTKIVFEGSGSFITGFIWIKVGGALFTPLFLISPYVRGKVFAASRESAASNKILYFTNRAYAAAGSLLVYFAILLAHPALVDATQSFRYVIIFFAAWLFLRERARGRVFIGKVIATLFIILGLFWLGVVSYSRSLPPPNPDRDIVWGVTFSEKFARELGIDERESFKSIISELKPSRVRLIAYWDEIEKENNAYDFSNLDWYFKEAAEANSKVILALGMKAPRWPECHIPGWASDLAPEEKENELLEYMEVTLNRYKENENIIMWQVENEPFLLFGECPGRVGNYMKNEVELVKSIDASKPVITTDGGETGIWWKTAQYGDVFGSTMYRKVYPVSIGKWTGVIEYPLNPNYFRVKEKLTRFILKDYEKRFIIIELQGEPWGEIATANLSYERQIEIFSIDYFRDTIRYAKDAGFDEYYLWGAEWWYYLKEKYNDSRYWDYAQEIFESSN